MGEENTIPLCSARYIAAVGLLPVWYRRSGFSTKLLNVVIDHRGAALEVETGLSLNVGIDQCYVSRLCKKEIQRDREKENKRNDWETGNEENSTRQQQLHQMWHLVHHISTCPLWYRAVKNLRNVSYQWNKTFNRSYIWNWMWDVECVRWFAYGTVWGTNCVSLSIRPRLWDC